MKQFLIVLLFAMVLSAQETEAIKSVEQDSKLEKPLSDKETLKSKEGEKDTTGAKEGEKDTTGAKKPEVKKVPLRIQASSSSYNSKKGIAIFKRNVVVEDGDFYLECDEMHIFYSKAIKATEATAKQKATPATKGGIEKIVAIDNVKIRQSPNTATSDKAVYLLKDQTITLTGNPILISEDGQKMKSDHFVIHRDSETIESGPITIESDNSLEKAK
ncbi:LptA/OstA family protein [Lentisphaera profundi]|uniref:LptA/OstA family protein n=1 Tax=Lentisphaera profundi TaxID=1658616 RepID=A0ABY7VV03_9BACT|nr:LptA/OstA family protein [Lentisphaera profundi]WDE97579.1 LptA/OstA family protein [Lentisphaera profundi]